MKPIKLILVLISVLLLNTNSFSQRRHGGKNGKVVVVKKRHGYRHRNKVVIVKRSPYRPNKIVVYKPYWRPNYAYNRRWVYFPRYNFYWDNWRSHYVYYDGGMWVSQPTAPAIIINVNLDKEKNYELKEEEEDEDDVYKSNDTHKTDYKPE